MAKKRALKPPPPLVNQDDFENIGRGQQLKQAKTVAEVQRIKIQNDILSGKVVDKNLVYQQLFEFGGMLRQRLESIPDRIVDQLLVTKDRAKAYQILMESIHEALEEITTMEGLKDRLTLSNKTENQD